MFLLWNRISWFTCYNWYCIHWCGFMTCVSLPCNRQPSPGFGIIYLVLAFCGCCLAGTLHIYLLLGLLILSIITEKVDCMIEDYKTNPITREDVIMLLYIVIRIIFTVIISHLVLTEV